MTNRYLEKVQPLRLYRDWQGNEGFFIRKKAGCDRVWHFMRYAPILIPIRLDVNASTILSGERYVILPAEPLTDDD